jgi:hypothetical protein
MQMQYWFITGGQGLYKDKNNGLGSRAKLPDCRACRHGLKTFSKEKDGKSRE